MEQVVWKFPIPAGCGVTVQMPVGAKIVSLGSQNGDVIAWALVDPESPLVHREIGYFATGAPVPNDWEYVGTAHVLTADNAAYGSWLVWHVFEEVRF